MKPRISELDLHRSVADFLSWTVLPPAVWTTFPAGWTAMKKGAAGRLKGCGLKAGMPDLFVFHNGGTIGIELKTQTEPSPAQREIFKQLRAAGVSVFVARSIDDVTQILRAHSIPMRKFSYASRLTTSEGRRPQELAQGESRAAP